MLLAKANPATGDRGAQKETTSWWDGPQNNRHARTSKAIRADLSGSDTCIALGLAINSSSPVLALCRALIAAGHDPAMPLEAYRDETLCLRVRSIGEAANIEVNGNTRFTFVGARKRRTAPPMRQIRRRAL
jgi:hypothetical protein